MMFKYLKIAASFLFGGSDSKDRNISKSMEVARGVGNWIDERDYTPEEKAKADADNLKTLLEGVKATQNESSVRSNTRRVLAWAIMGVFLLAFIVCFVIKLFGGDITDLLEVSCQLDT